MLTRQRSTSEHPERQLILPNDRVAIVMVGLPARGKSFMAKKVFRYLHHLRIITKVFNFGSYRRIATKNTTVGKASASFFDPDNKQGAKIRRQCCIEALNDLVSWYNTGGQIGILDATNTTLERRQLIRHFFSKKISELEYNISILHIESICNDESIIHNNIISVKLKNPDYCTVDAQKAIKDFKERIKMYKKAYVEVSKEEGSYIKVINVGTEVTGHLIDDYISCRIFYFLMHLHLHHLSKTPKKPLLMQLSNRSDAQKDNEMANKLKQISASVGAKFKRPAFDRPVHALAPFMRRPSYLMWNESEDTYKASPYKASPEIVKSTTNNSSAQITPLKMDSHNVSFEKSTSCTPIQINASVTASTPTTGATTGSGGPYIRQRPKVRKSTLIHKMVIKRDIIQESPSKSGSCDLQNMYYHSVDKVASGYHSDNEEDSDDMDESHEHKVSDNNIHYQNSKVSKLTKISTDTVGMNILQHKMGKGVSPIVEYNGHEYKASDIEGIDENEEEEFESSGNEDFHCELCGRTVLKKDTNLVESRHNNAQKVRICEVCLYETDSEDDSCEMIDIMHSGPTSTIHSTSGSPEDNNSEFTYDIQMGAVQRKVQEMENTVNIMLSQLNNNENDTDKNIKEELVRLQQKMQQLFQ